MLQKHSERAHDRGHCRLQGNDVNFVYAGHCACPCACACWALLWNCSPFCWATHGWPRIKENVERCCAKSLTSFKFDATRLNTVQHLSTGCSNALNLLSSTCWELVQWTNPVHLHAALHFLPMRHVTGLDFSAAARLVVFSLSISWQYLLLNRHQEFQCSVCESVGSGTPTLLCDVPHPVWSFNHSSTHCVL